jgi:hypothetical protein
MLRVFTILGAALVVLVPSIGNARAAPRASAEKAAAIESAAGNFVVAIRTT